MICTNKSHIIQKNKSKISKYQTMRHNQTLLKTNLLIKIIKELSHQVLLVSPGSSLNIPCVIVNQAKIWLHAWDFRDLISSLIPIFLLWKPKIYLIKSFPKFSLHQPLMLSCEPNILNSLLVFNASMGKIKKSNFLFKVLPNIPVL